MAYLFCDVKIAVRHLIRSPGFVTAALLMLALGIGAMTAIFSLVEGVLLRPLPFPQSDQIMVISDTLSGVDMPAKGSVGVTPGRHPQLHAGHTQFHKSRRLSANRT